MLNIFQALVLGLLQGFTELFPVSSLGHSVLIPALFNWQVDQSSPYFVSFLVLTHLATALVLLAFFWRDWVKVVVGIVRSIATRSLADPYAKLGWLLVIGTIPAGLVGLALQKKIEALFAAPEMVALFLIANGLLLYGAEWLGRRSRRSAAARAEAARVAAPSAPSNSISSDSSSSIDARVSALSWKSALGIGLMQCLALLPGFSRTGATITGGLAAGLSHEDAARFSFLLATPIILAAAVLKVPHLAFVGGQGIAIALAGALAAAIAAYIAVRYLGRYFKTKTLNPFAAYCIGLGIASLFILATSY